jgi:murein DD-endopeptidase MepM/ murein hydrolase activator NlpD
MVADTAITLTNPVADRYPVTGRYLETTPPTWSVDRPHLGVDFGAPFGANVVSCTLPGKVIEVHIDGVNPQGDGSFGTCIIVDVPNTPWYFLYAHLSEALAIVGQDVTAEMLIGKVGSTGKAEGAHLHVQKSTDKNFSRDLTVIGDPMFMMTPVPGPSLEARVARIERALKALTDELAKG